MKKILSIMLVLTMVFAMTASVVAAEETRKGDEITDLTNVDATVTVTSADVATVYHVKTSWEALTFTYSGLIWDPEILAYKPAGNEAGFGVNNSKTINVENRSNAPVKVSAKFGTADSVTKDGVIATLTNNTFDLVSADSDGAISVIDGNKKGPNDNITVTVSGTPEKNTEIAVGTITIKFAAGTNA